MNSKDIVGDFFEEKLSKILDMIRVDKSLRGKLPDLISKDGSYVIEVKASAYNNGGVINQRQLFKFDREINLRRFYGFPYHSIKKIRGVYDTEEKLRGALDLRSLFIFPFSIVLAHFENSRKTSNPKHDTFVQLNERDSNKIFNREKDIWNFLGLNKIEYYKKELHEKVKLITRKGYLEKQIEESFHQEFI